MKDDGKVVVITGGAQGIGRGMVDYFLGAGWSVAALDIDGEAGEELVTMHGQQPRLAYYQVDVGDEDGVAACMKRVVERFGAIDGLVNNAGIADPGRTPVTELALADWEKMLTTNLTGAFLMAKYTVPHLRRRSGALVNIASTRALQSEANTEAYGASKGGLVALTHSLAVSLGPEVRVNCILPGWIDVSGLKKRAARVEPQLSREDHLQHPVGRVGVAADVAGLAAFLLGEEAGFITGQAFVVDGGMTRKMIYC